VPLYIRESINKFIKGALARNISAELINRLLKITQLAEESRERRRRISRRVIQKGGVIRIYKARK
jgi:hypothetical protein